MRTPGASLSNSPAILANRSPAGSRESIIPQDRRTPMRTLSPIAHCVIGWSHLSTKNEELRAILLLKARIDDQCGGVRGLPAVPFSTTSTSVVVLIAGGIAPYSA